MFYKLFFRRILIMICLLAFLVTPVMATPKKTTRKKAATATHKTISSVARDMDYASLAEKVLPSIVQIITDRASGSGFFASNNGDILTNYHVIEGAQEIIVNTHEGNSFYAMIKDVAQDKDMALLVINNIHPTPFLKISSALPRQGEAVMAVGNPRGFEGTISNGIISAFRENNTWIQFTAPISPGSSGGVLVNSLGEVVGMTTLLYRESQNLNFAIASLVLQNFFKSAQVKTPTTTIPKDIDNKVETIEEAWDSWPWYLTTRFDKFSF